MIWKIQSRMSLAFDNEGNRDTSNDDWRIEMVSLPDDIEIVKEFARNRNPKSIGVWVDRVPDCESK